MEYVYAAILAIATICLLVSAGYLFSSKNKIAGGIALFMGIAMLVLLYLSQGLLGITWPEWQQ